MSGSCSWDSDLGSECDAYWSSSADENNDVHPNRAWGVDFNAGNMGYFIKSNPYRVRCVTECSPEHLDGACEADSFCCDTGECKKLGECYADKDCNSSVHPICNADSPPSICVSLDFSYCASNGRCLNEDAPNCANDDDCDAIMGQGWECVKEPAEEIGTCYERETCGPDKTSCIPEDCCVETKLCSSEENCLNWTQCDNHSDCLGGEKCSFACDDTGNRFCIHHTQCEVDQDCFSGDTCSYANPRRCFDQGDCMEPGQGGDCRCFANNDCPPGQNCPKYCSVTDTTACDLDSDCLADQTCVSTEVCTASTSVCENNSFHRACGSPFDLFCCATNHHCSETDTTECDSDSDCPAGETCDSDCCPIGRRCSAGEPMRSCIPEGDCVNDNDCLTGFTVCNGVYECEAVPGKECDPGVCTGGQGVPCTTCEFGEYCSLDRVCIPNANCLSDLRDCPDGELCTPEYECVPGPECGFAEFNIEVAPCIFELPGVPPNEFRIFVYLDDGSGVLTRLARDVTQVEGWDYNSGTNQIELFHVVSGPATLVVLCGAVPGDEPCPTQCSP